MLTPKETELLKKLIDAERRYWLCVIANDADWRNRGIEVGVDLSKTQKRPWLEAAEKLVDAGLAEWCEGHIENNYLRLACGDLNRLEDFDPR